MRKNSLLGLMAASLLMVGCLGTVPPTVGPDAARSLFGFHSLMTAPSGSPWGTIAADTTSLTSTCTLRTGIASPRYVRFKQASSATYGSTIQSQTSNDGATWSAALETTLTAPSGRNIRNPAVLRLPAGQWLMIYESADPASPTGSSSAPLRFHRALSSDGITFANADPGAGYVLEGNSLDNYFISVPDLFKPTGIPLIGMYYVVNGDEIAYAESTDFGTTWTVRGPVTISGLPGSYPVVDPDIVEDGGASKLVLYVCTGTLGARSIYACRGTTPRSFTCDSTAALSPDATATTQEDVMDPDVVKSLTGWLMYVGLNTFDTTTGPATLTSTDLWRAEATAL